MKVTIESSKIVKPDYEGDHPPSLTQRIALSVFDKVNYDTHIAMIFANRPPTPKNSSIEQGLRKVLAEYREWAGRLGRDDNGNPVDILLNDEGVNFIEASSECTLDEAMPSKPSAELLHLHPSPHCTMEELFQVQVTRFACGSIVVGFTTHHLVADGPATCAFVVAWGQACRGLEINPRPFHNRTIFAPRSPPQFEFEHRGVEYKVKSIAPKKYPFSDSIDHIIVHKVHFTLDFLATLKAKASSDSSRDDIIYRKPYSTFESLSAHLWRVMTRARGLNEFQMTQIRISVNGRSRLTKPLVPHEYFGNLVLWALPTARVKDLLREPLHYAAKTIRNEIEKVNDIYFKSFIDFSNQKLVEEDLIPTADAEKPVLYPNVDVDSWLQFPFHEVDFGAGKPYIFMPSYLPVEGLVLLMPSLIGDGSIDAYISMFEHNLEAFKRSCYSLGGYTLKSLLEGYYFPCVGVVRHP